MKTRIKVKSRATGRIYDALVMTENLYFNKWRAMILVNTNYGLFYDGVSYSEAAAIEKLREQLQNWQKV